MKKKLILMLMSLCLAFFAKAEVTDISGIENVVYVESMSCSAGSSSIMSVKMKNTQAITGFQFDLVLPAGITVKQEDGFYSIELSTVRTTAKKTNYFDSALQLDGSIRVMASSTQNYTFSGNDGEVATIEIAVAGGVADNIYPVTIKNIVLSDAASNSYETIVTTSYVKVGSPSNASITLDGHVSSEVLTAISSDASITTIDMSNVTSIDGTLNLNDNKNFVAPTSEVNVAGVNYQRALEADWGTICLPIALQSDATIQYYKLTSVSSTTMSFSPVTSLAAGEPAIFKRLNSGNLGISASNVTISAGSKVKAQDASNWTMKGTYTSIDNNPAECANDIYYIAGDKFYYANQTFPVPAFRGWFETPKTSSSKGHTFSITDDGETTGINYIEKPDGTVDVVFDITGRKLSSPKNGINIINGKKIIIK